MDFIGRFMRASGPQLCSEFALYDRTVGRGGALCVRVIGWAARKQAVGCASLPKADDGQEGKCGTETLDS